MKKTYIVPETGIIVLQTEEMLAASITNVGGDSGLDLGTGDTPDVANSKGKGSVFGETFWED